MLTDEDGSALVRWARRSIEEAVGGPTVSEFRSPEGSSLLERRGVFVTLRRHPGGALRGCIGYPTATWPLRRAVARAAGAAATEDPRFRPVEREELHAIVIEVSVLTLPKALPPEHRETEIEIGRDGLIVETEETSGLLLPQVAPEMDWSAEEFLGGVCEKAGLPVGAWRDPGVRLLRFEAEIFHERTPGGRVERGGRPVTTADERRARRT